MRTIARLLFVCGCTALGCGASLDAGGAGAGGRGGESGAGGSGARTDGGSPAAGTGGGGRGGGAAGSTGSGAAAGSTGGGGAVVPPRQISFRAARDYPFTGYTRQPGVIAAADLDGDGLPDLAIAQDAPDAV